MSLPGLASERPLRICLIRCGDPVGLGFAGVFQVLQLATGSLGEAQLQLEVVTPSQLPQTRAHLVLLVADDAGPIDAGLIEYCRLAKSYALVGMQADATRLYDLEQHPMTCCGGAAAIDFALALVDALFGPALQAEIMEALAISQVRPGDEPRPQARTRLPAELAEALRLMETHIEEPLNADDIANLAGISRRQLERLFKQYMGNMPARYYLELRLQRARALLLESHHSIVQVGLMCGFSSGAHFATAYGTLYGITPRDERQRKLAAARI